jgi:predicted phosphate transport protein (TIGR00153 family)
MAGLLRRDRRFFQLLDETADGVVETAHLLLDLVDNYENVPEKVTRIRAREKQSDELTDKIINEVNRTFITPIDREDIQRLARTMDRALNYINGVAGRMFSYGLAEPTTDLRAQVAHLVKTVEAMREAVRGLENGKGVVEKCEQISALESQGDSIYREALHNLFADGNADPLRVVKLKDIHEAVENASDRCEDVADMIEEVVVKHS